MARSAVLEKRYMRQHQARLQSFRIRSGLACIAKCFARMELSAKRRRADGLLPSRARTAVDAAQRQTEEAKAPANDEVRS